jgi:hypothetical protein
VIHLLFILVARKVDEAAIFVFMQLIEQESGIYDIATETMLRGTKLIWLGKEFLLRRRNLETKYKHLSLNCHERPDVTNVFFSYYCI